MEQRDWERLFTLHGRREIGDDEGPRLYLEHRFINPNRIVLEHRGL